MSQKFSGQEYLEKAQELLDVFQPELAVKFLVRAFEVEAQLEVAKKIASTYMDLLQVSARNEAEAAEYGQLALEWLLKWLELSQGSEWEPLVSLATLHIGKQAVDYYERALVILRQKIDLDKDRRHLSDALCALAELYMTDCW